MSKNFLVIGFKRQNQYRNNRWLQEIVWICWKIDWIKGPLNNHKLHQKTVSQIVPFFLQNQPKPGKVWLNQTKPKPMSIYSNRGFVPLSLWFWCWKIRGSTELRLRLVVCDTHRLPPFLLTGVVSQTRVRRNYAFGLWSATPIVCRHFWLWEKRIVFYL